MILDSKVGIQNQRIRIQILKQNQNQGIEIQNQNQGIRIHIGKNALWGQKLFEAAF